MKNRLLYTSLLLAATILSCKRSIRDLLTEADSLADKERYRDAIDIYSKLLHQNSKIQTAYYNRAFCYKQIGNIDSALKDYTKVLDLQTNGNARFQIFPNPLTQPDDDDPTNYNADYNDALYQRAMLRYQIDSLKPAFQDFNLLLADSYQISNTNLWLGAIMLRRNEISKAREYFNAGLNRAYTREDSAEAYKMLRQLDTIKATNR